MQIYLCKKSIDRLPGGREPLLAALREREHSPVVKDCLDRCQRCDQGLLMATAEGTPISTRDVETLLSDLDALAGEDL